MINGREDGFGDGLSKGADRGIPVVLFVDSAASALESGVQILDPLFRNVLLIREKHTLGELLRGGARRADELFLADCSPGAEVLTDGGF